MPQVSQSHSHTLVRGELAIPGEPQKRGNFSSWEPAVELK